MGVILPQQGGDWFLEVKKKKSYSFYMHKKHSYYRIGEWFLNAVWNLLATNSSFIKLSYLPGDRKFWGKSSCSPEFSVQHQEVKSF